MAFVVCAHRCLMCHSSGRSLSGTLPGSMAFQASLYVKCLYLCALACFIATKAISPWHVPTGLAMSIPSRSYENSIMCCNGYIDDTLVQRWVPPNTNLTLTEHHVCAIQCPSSKSELRGVKFDHSFWLHRSSATS